MSNHTSDDRSHTTDWDAGEVRREAAQQEAGGQPRRAAGPAPSKKRKKRRRTNPLLAILLWLAIVAASSAILAGVGWLLANDFAALNKQPYKEVNFQVPEEWIIGTETDEDGDEITLYDTGKVSDALKDAGLIEYKWFFQLFCKVYHADEKISQGTFALNTNMDYMALIRNMRSKGGSAVTVDVTIPEGFTVQQIIGLLAENGVASAEDLTDAAANYDFDSFDFLEDAETGSISRLEGYLFPDTYNFYVGGKPELAFSAMLSNFKSKVYDSEDFAEDLAALAEAGQYSLSDIITIASLIEKETDGSDRGNISSVIYNRLENDGETHFLLQIDAALVYAAGRPITQTDYTTLNSPYNLYQHTGLPPTPIANPGLASIQAALHPADTGYYFYVLGEDDKHIFNETLAGHEATLAQLQSQSDPE